MKLTVPASTKCEDIIVRGRSLLDSVATVIRDATLRDLQYLGVRREAYREGIRWIIVDFEHRSWGSGTQVWQSYLIPVSFFESLWKTLVMRFLYRFAARLLTQLGDEKQRAPVEIVNEVASICEVQSARLQRTCRRVWGNVLPERIETLVKPLQEATVHCRRLAMELRGAQQQCHQVNDST